MSVNDEEKELISCEHYQRKCSLLAPCCNKAYTCRLCHDESETHSLERTTVVQIICSQCNKKQQVGRNCTECGILFGKYSCLICRLFDDRDKAQFHCSGCGICRVGGEDNFYHCQKCNMCIGVSIKDSHKCLENVSRNKCPVCLEDLHTSRQPSHMPKCAHMLHRKCLNDLLTHGISSCPMCNESMVDMSSYWKTLDDEIQHTFMPESFRTYRVNVLCRDCHQKTKPLFHVSGLKCGACGGYNTTRIGGDDPPPDEFNGESSGDLANGTEPDDNSWETVSVEEIAVEGFDGVVGYGAVIRLTENDNITTDTVANLSVELNNEPSVD